MSWNANPITQNIAQTSNFFCPFIQIFHYYEVSQNGLCDWKNKIAQSTYKQKCTPLYEVKVNCTVVHGDQILNSKL